MKFIMDFGRLRLDFGRLRQVQVDGINAIMKAGDHLPVHHLAYVLATAWHETGPTSHKIHMQPRYEAGAKYYFNKYDAGTPLGKRLGNTIKGDGYRFRGRGYVQITGRANYAKLSKFVGIDLVANPDSALLPEIAVLILIRGMEHGVFTGKPMAYYTGYNAMRRVVNGTDKASLIAGYAIKFENALEYATA
jgi:putative chitinase